MSVDAQTEEGDTSSKKVVAVEKDETETSVSGVPNDLSMMCDQSTGPPIYFSGKPGFHEKTPVSGCVSMSSNMDPQHTFSKDLGDHLEGPVSPVPSYTSMKSNMSMKLPNTLPNEPSCVSMKSNCSMDPPNSFSKEPFSPEQRIRTMKEDQTTDHPDEMENVSAVDPKMYQHLQPCVVAEIQNKLKATLKKRYQFVFEGLTQKRSITLHNDIYTELYITEGGCLEVNNKHEIIQIETASRRPATQDTPIKFNDMYNLPGRDRQIKNVLTKGVAGIGKTISVGKFILDWAEGKANQDIEFIFPIPFRELNMIGTKICSLMDLLHSFFEELKEYKMIDYDECKVLFILDGLDECQLPFNFKTNKRCSDVSESASVDLLLTNLISRNLLPTALIWITCRPAAASQIPSECIDLVTEVRGFNDQQKEEYFRKRFGDEKLAGRIFSHIKSSVSLYIMCHIPVFCWISSTVLERVLAESESKEIPKTLTQMCIHFLIFQIKQSSRKFLGEDDHHKNTEMIMKLGKLAYQQLNKLNLIFYEADLRKCDIDVTEASVYSGVCTQIFIEEHGLCQEKVYCFVHLIIQEFLAALYVFLTLKNTNVNLLSYGVNIQSTSGETPVMFLLKDAVDKAIQSKNGHLDLFLRFLLGLSLEDNQTLLQRLLTQKGRLSQTSEETTLYIKMKIKKNLSPERCINLFHCLNELNDHSLVEEIQSYLNKGRLSEAELSPAQWSALVFVLLTSEEKQDVFDLRKYFKSEEGLKRLLPVLKSTKTAILINCNLTETCCESLASALKWTCSSLRDLDLSDNKLQDSGVTRFSTGLKNLNCKLKTLRLKNCGMTKEGCDSLALALKTNSAHLRDLDLSKNILGDSGLKLLCTVLKDPNCKVEILCLSSCGVRRDGCDFLASALRSNPSHLRNLDMSRNKLKDTGVKLLSAELKNLQCMLEKLRLYNSETTEEGLSYLADAFTTNPSHIRELDVGGNNLGVSGIKKIGAVLKEPLCKLETLRLPSCGLTEESTTILISALRSNPSHIRELDLTNNQPGDSGVKILSAVLEEPLCKLERLSLKCCNLTEKCCGSLASALSSTSLKELYLSHNNLQDSGVKLLSAGLGNPHCKLGTFKLTGCTVTEEGCIQMKVTFFD
ncbi:hypothetical protein DPEC_G00166240 [Dallia pectoralis]|uniref:Uncharacterized protein n=1 Tax=Dallia pectoralis TaxID=75939 RepID=A0ACC2GHJ1_DALPE|nr:hypothetical protein DPEC_G00166240 [Dallia pectoralis]